MTPPLFDAGCLTADQQEALRELNLIAAEKGHGLMLIGATARLLRLDWPLKLPPTRTTKDVDLLVRLRSWAEHDELMRAATRAENGPFEIRANQPHRLCHRRSGAPLDLVPFGELERPPGTLQWPHNDRTMTVCGMAEAEESASVLELGPGLEMRVINLPCFVGLKLFAWEDRHYMGAGDLQDADFVLRRCVALPDFEERSWSAYAEAAEGEGLAGLDYEEHAGAAVIARDLAQMLRPETRKRPG